MVTIDELNGMIQKKVFGGSKVPHGVSNPVIRKENGQYYIAYFVYTYDKKNIDTGEYRRPIQWLLVDVKTGEIVNTYNCQEYDFSTQSFDRLYSLIDDSVKRPNENYFKIMDNLFDTVRASIAYGNKMDIDSYKAYFSNVLAITPKEYKVFYRELSA